MACQLLNLFSKVPCTRITGSGWAAVGVQGTLAPGGGGAAAEAAAGRASASAQANRATTALLEVMTHGFPASTRKERGVGPPRAPRHLERRRPGHPPTRAARGRGLGRRRRDRAPGGHEAHPPHLAGRPGGARPLARAVPTRRRPAP